MTRRLLKYIPILSVFLLLAGCSPANAPIDPANNFFDRFFVGPLAETLDWFAALLWGQYGLSILVVTIIIRFIILPLTLKQYRSGKRMQEIQPELKKIKDKYKDDVKKQQEETMKLFQKEGVNPLAGCFPVLIQMPILIALYNAIMRNHHIGEHSFLWMQLGTKDPFYILPILAAITTFLQQKIMMKTQPTIGPNPMQSLLYVFPVLIFVMAMNFASALPLYWVYSNVFTIVQTYFIYGNPNKKPDLSKK